MGISKVPVALRNVFSLKSPKIIQLRITNGHFMDPVENYRKYNTKALRIYAVLSTISFISQQNQ
jgi:hypothetical protein